VENARRRFPRTRHASQEGLKNIGTWAADPDRVPVGQPLGGMAQRKAWPQACRWALTGDVCEDNFLSDIVQQQAYEACAKLLASNSTAFILR
jgi:hypothetical protein